MASSSTRPPKRGRGYRPPPPPPDSPPDSPIFSSQKSSKYGLFFREEAALNRFEELRTWKQGATLFPRLNALRFLHAFEAVVQLFGHIGWTPVLQWSELSYEVPTLEFLCTAYLSPDREHLEFQTENTETYMSLTDINSLGSTNEGLMTYGPDSLPNIGLEEAVFWREISDDPRVYNPRVAKASWISHPALKLAHRIIAHLFFARDDAGTVSSLELHLLYAMTHGAPNDNYRPRPDFARWLLYKPLQVPSRPQCTIRCGGIITKLLKSQFVPEHLRLVDDDRKRAKGDTELSVDVLKRTNMFRYHKNRVGNISHIVWLRGTQRAPYLRVPESVHDPEAWMLRLTPDVRDQQWKLPDNTIGPVPEDIYQPPMGPQHDHIEDEDAPHQVPPPGYPPYHFQYMSEFEYLRQHQTAMEANLTGFRSDFNAERALALAERQQAEAFRVEQRAHLEEMLRLQRQMHAFYFPAQPRPPPPPPY